MEYEVVVDRCASRMLLLFFFSAVTRVVVKMIFAGERNNKPQEAGRGGKKSE